MKNKITHQQLIQQLEAIGVQQGDTLIVHASFSKIQPIENGVQGMIKALELILGEEGTLVMPSMSWEDEKIFDPKTTHCREMGILADTFWRQEGVFRSSNAHAFAAKGKYAEQIVDALPLDDPTGLRSPVGQVYELNGTVLLLGVGQDANTTIHLGENLAGVRYRLPKKLRILQDNQPIWFEYEEVDHCCQNFVLVDDWLSAHNQIHYGTVGHATARLMQSRHIVDAVIDHLSQDETTFLHPYGFDEECDAARDSLKKFLS